MAGLDWIYTASKGKAQGAGAQSKPLGTPVPLQEKDWTTGECHGCTIRDLWLEKRETPQTHNGKLSRGRNVNLLLTYNVYKSWQSPGSSGTTVNNQVYTNSLLH